MVSHASVMTDAVVSHIFTGKTSKPRGIIGRKNHELQETPVVPYKALYGTTAGTYSARFFFAMS